MTHVVLYCSATVAGTVKNLAVLYRRQGKTKAAEMLEECLVWSKRNAQVCNLYKFLVDDNCDRKWYLLFLICQLMCLPARCRYAQFT